MITKVNPLTSIFCTYFAQSAFAPTLTNTFNDGYLSDNPVEPANREYPLLNREEVRLLEHIRENSIKSRSLLFNGSVSALLRACQNKNPFSIGYPIRALIRSINKFLDHEREETEVPVSELFNIASSLYLANRLSYISEIPDHSFPASFLTALTKFDEYIDSRSEKQPGLEKMIQDRLITKMTLILQDEIAQINMQTSLPDFQAPIGAITRTAILSGLKVWPSNGIHLPRASLSLENMYLDIGSQWRSSKGLSVPSAYTRIMAQLNPKPQSLIDHMLTVYIESSTSRALELFRQHKENSRTRRSKPVKAIAKIIGRKSTPERSNPSIVAELLKASDMGEKQAPSIASFLRNSME